MNARQDRAIHRYGAMLSIGATIGAAFVLVPAPGVGGLGYVGSIVASIVLLGIGYAGYRAARGRFSVVRYSD